MSKDLDLDDVAATSPKAAQELQSLRQQVKLLRDALDTVSKCIVAEDCRLIAVNALPLTEPKP